MNRNEISQRVDTIISTSVNHHNYEFSEMLTPQNVVGWDSLANAMILTAIEKEFSIKFKFSDMIAWKNVSELIDIIMKQVE